MGNKILKTSIQVGIAVLIIKALGLIKQSIIASICGATYETDLYFLSSGLITQLCTVIFSAITVSLLSLYVEKLYKEGRTKADSIINSILKVIIPFSIIIGLICVFGSPVLAKLLAPSYNDDELNELSNFIRILSILFVTNAYFLTINVVLEANKKMLSGKLLAFLQNLFVIIFAIVLYKKIGISALLYSLIIANFVACIYITIRSRKYLKLSIRSSFSKEEVKTVLFLMVPLLIGNAMYEINDIVDKQIASNLDYGTVSYLSYGTSLNEIVTSLVITTVSSVLFVNYASWVSEGRNEKVGNGLMSSLSGLTFVLLPITVMTIIFRNEIVAIVYGRGAFLEKDIVETGYVVLGYSFGFIGQAFRANIVKVFYAYKKTKIPMVNGIISVGINIGLSYWFASFMGVAGVALATSIAMTISTIMLLLCIKNLVVISNIKSHLINYCKLIIAFFISFVSCYLLSKTYDANNFVKLIVAGFLCLFTFLCSCIVLQENNIELFEKKFGVLFMSNDKKREDRNSSIELLRVIAMILIIGSHLVYYGVQKCNTTSSFELFHEGSTFNKVFSEILRPGGDIGVALFMLITGFYLCKSKSIKLKQLIKISLAGVFYGLICLIAYFCLKYFKLNIAEISNTNVIQWVTQAITNTLFSGAWWYISAYLLIVLLAPCINSLLIRLNKKGYLLVILIYFVLFFFIGRVIGGEYYNIARLLMFYLIGSYVSTYKIHEFFNNKKIFMFFSIIILWGCSAFGYYYMHTHIIGDDSTIYVILNQFILSLIFSVFVSGTAIFMFLLSLNLSFKSRIINTLASFTLGIYMLHDSYIIRALLWNGIIDFDKIYLSNLFPIYSLLIVFGVFVVGCIVDYVRQALFEKPIFNLFKSKSSNLSNRFLNAKNQEESISTK